MFEAVLGIITGHHRRNGTDNRNYFPTVPEAGSPRSGGQGAWLLARTPPSGYVLTWQRERDRQIMFWGVSPCKNTNPIMGTYPMTSSNHKKLPKAPPPNTKSSGRRR